MSRSAEVKMVSFSTTDTGTASRVTKGNTVYTDSPNYLPPNSFASAKVIVGVDAAAGVNSQTDPLPVVQPTRSRKARVRSMRSPAAGRWKQCVMPSTDACAR